MDGAGSELVAKCDHLDAAIEPEKPELSAPVMKPKLSVVPAVPLEKWILTVRSERVILDLDLADLYGVSTKAVN